MNLSISNFLRQGLLLLVLVATLGATAQTGRLRDSEEALHEKLLDAAALINRHLQDAVTNIQEADQYWEELIAYKVKHANDDYSIVPAWGEAVERGKEIRQQQLQLAWQGVVTALDGYAIEKKAGKEAKGKTRKK
jgi:hypothetical protein